jgi:hypothetical protein
MILCTIIFFLLVGSGLMIVGIRNDIVKKK